MNKESFFNEMDQLISVSSREKEVREQMKLIAKQAKYNVVFDRLGSCFAHIPCHQPHPKKVMISFPMDEYGYMVCKIHDNGRLSFVGVNTSNPHEWLGCKLCLQTDKKRVEGYVVATKENKKGEYLGYFGFASKQDAIQQGVCMGDCIVVLQPLQYLKPCYIGRSLDVKIGMYLFAQFLEASKHLSFPFDVYIGGVVQEKVGYRGSVSSVTTIEPSMNVSLAFEQESESYALGSGMFVKSFDPTLLPNRDLYHFVLDHTQAHAHTSQTGTSASFIHKSCDGVPSVVVGIHGVNIGLPTMMFEQQDIEDLCNAMIQLCQTLQVQDIDRFMGSDDDESFA